MAPPPTLLTNALKRCRLALTTIGVTSLFVNLLMLTVPLYMLQLYDRVIASRSQETLVYLTLAAIGALLVLSTLDTLRSRISVRVGTWLEARLGPDFLSHSVAGLLQSQRYGVQALRDLSQLRQFISSPTVFSLFDAPWVPFYLTVIYLLHPVLGNIALGGAVLLFALALTNELATRKALKAANEQSVQAMRKTEAATRNAEVIEAMGMMPGVVRRWSEDNATALQLQSIASDRAGAILATSKLVRLTIQILMLGTGAYLVIGYELTPGGMIAGSIILSRALQPVEQAIGTWKSVVAARTAYDRLNHFLRAVKTRDSEMPMPRPAGNLRVEGVSFVPRGSETPILRGISFAIAAGEFLTVVGPSAAGKSTLARLIVGAWQPTRGNVRLDGADVSTQDRATFGRHIGYLPQDVELFDGSVADNISRLEEVEPEAVIEAARLAGVHDMILRLPQGYGTQIGAGGAVLSGGQRQRIALARAVFGHPRLLVLDEPNASLDAEGEAALAQAIQTLKADGATIVLIAHRVGLISQADKILVLRQGQTDLFGPRAEVLAKLSGQNPGSQATRPPRPPARDLALSS